MPGLTATPPSERERDLESDLELVARTILEKHGGDVKKVAKMYGSDVASTLVDAAENALSSEYVPIHDRNADEIYDLLHQWEISNLLGRRQKADDLVEFSIGAYSPNRAHHQPLDYLRFPYAEASSGILATEYHQLTFVVPQIPAHPELMRMLFERQVYEQLGLIHI